MNKTRLAASLAALALSAAGAHATGVDVYAGYDDNYDDSFFKVANTTSFDVTNLTFTGTLGSDVQTWSWGTVGANSTATNYFAGTGAFQYDFDDYYQGAASYTVSGQVNGHAFSVDFTPATNASGQFVGFLGNDANGWETDAPAYGMVAHIDPVPEPGTIGLMLAGLGMMGVVARRRRG